MLDKHIEILQRKKPTLNKQASLSFFKAVGKAAKESLLGTNKAKGIASHGPMQQYRAAAGKAHSKVKDKLDGAVHRSRTKTHKSISNKGIKPDDADDLLGVQMYSKHPDKGLSKAEKVFDSGNYDIKKLNRKGYKGINVKGEVDGIPTEVQLSPGRRSNFGQILQHNAYKPPEDFTEWDRRQADRVGSYFAGKIPKA